MRSDYDIFNDDSIGGAFVGSPEAFELHLNQSCLSCKPRTPQESFFIATNICATGRHPRLPSIIRTIFGRKKIDRQISSLKDQYCSSLLHYAAEYLGQHHAVMTRKDSICQLRKAGAETITLNRADAFWSRWNQCELEANLLLVRDLVLADSGLAERNCLLHTPLLEICHGISTVQEAWVEFAAIFKVNTSWQIIPVQSAEVPIRLWLQKIAGAGVDLIEYGRRESRLHRKHQVKKQWDVFDEDLNSPTCGKRVFTLRLISFTYGPLPEDWQFWFTEAMDISFLEFWQMVEHPERGMPGAWNEFDYYDDNISWLGDSEDDSSGFGNSGYKSDGEGESKERDGDENGDDDGGENKNEKHNDHDKSAKSGISRENGADKV
jgi:hypothetical protein